MRRKDGSGTHVRATLRGTATVMALVVAGCATQQQSMVIGQTAGSLVGGGLGALVGRELGGTGGMIAGGILGGVLGAFVGSEIGRALSPEDQTLAAQATLEALQSAPPPPAAPPPSTTGASAPERRPAAEPAPRARPVGSAPAPAAETTPVVWQSTTNPGVHGSATVVDGRTTADGRACQKVEERAYVGGKELQQAVWLCQAADGSWSKAPVPV